VVTAQTAYLQSRRSELDLTTRYRQAGVQLVKAIGGGWSAAPEPAEPATPAA
jgi:outer membrane protein TolC